ncbi:helix-turn-helix transcriptional regulator [Roseateles sp.]|jgi:DNA-binding CsgD family transcriptional regulator|uniref:helix-turn-helix transcriptional regulator n=1 Tax=Roseateles sp. TaxID=1971397 RepID=UPI0037C69125
MLHGGYQSVLEARSREEFRGEVIRFAQGLGFESVSATAVQDQSVGHAVFESVDNIRPDYLEHFEDVGNWRVDPVAQHCKRSSMPIVWDQSTYTTAGLGQLWESQAHYGYHTGICLALHMPEGRHFILGVDRAQSLHDEGGDVTRLVADLQLFAVCAQEAAWRLLMPSHFSAQSLNAHLTPRELECLRWTMEGKTAWEVGTILSISERTAVLHINNAMRKLDCSSKHQAVLKALRLGLIR